MSFTSYSYKTRTAGFIPIEGKFIAHTFKAEKSEITIHEAITELKGPTEMTGRGGNYVLISYNALPYVLGGQLAFSGQETKRPEYIDENEVPGV